MGEMLEKVSPELQIFIIADILFQAFKAIFVSLSAAEALENESAKGTSSARHHWGERQTWAHVAKLIDIKSVEPRAIAYAACQVSWSLSIDINYYADRSLDLLVASFCPVLCRVVGHCWWCVRHQWVLQGDSGMVWGNQDWGGQEVSQRPFVVVEQVSLGCFTSWLALIGKYRRIFGLTFAFQFEWDHSVQRSVAKSLKTHCTVTTSGPTTVE